MRPTFQDFNEALAYDDMTGVLSWKIRPSARTFPGDIIRAKDTHGYIMFGFKRLSVFRGWNDLRTYPHVDQLQRLEGLSRDSE